MSETFRDIRRQLEEKWVVSQRQWQADQEQDRERAQRWQNDKKARYEQALRHIEAARDLSQRLGLRVLLESLRREVWAGKGEVTQDQSVYYPDAAGQINIHNYWRYRLMLRSFSSKKFEHKDLKMDVGHVTSVIGYHATWGIVYDQVGIELFGETQKSFREGKVAVSDERTEYSESHSNIGEREVKGYLAKNEGYRNANGPWPYVMEKFVIGEVGADQIKNALAKGSLARGYSNLPR